MWITDFLLKHGFYTYIAGIALALIGFILLVVVAFRTRLRWGVLVLLLPPTAAIFVIRHTRRAAIPLLFVGMSALLLGATYATHYFHYIDLGPRERIVNGERHITLTGWDRSDYQVLASRPDTVVLQMANPDVTDQTLEFLKGMENLRELDLDYTQVTDDGLRALSQLPSLAILRLTDTQVSDAGFRDHLFEKDTMLEVDLTGTQVATKTLREWKAKKSAQRKFLR